MKILTNNIKSMLGQAKSQKPKAKKIATSNQQLATKLLFTLYFILASIQSFAQIYPVQVTPQMVPPYSLKLSEYQTTASEKLFVNLLLTDAQETNRQVRLKMYIEGQGLNIETVDFVTGAPPIFLDGGINQRISNIDIRPYFNYSNLTGITYNQFNESLPDGVYNFCFEVYDVFSGQQISQKSCTSAYLILNDPPFLNVPGDGDLVTAQTPQNIIFNWTPRHVNATNVQYEFTLKELWDTQVDPQAAFLVSPALHQETTFATTLHYGPANVQLLEDKLYGWQVRAIVTDGISETSVFRNDGYSEIYYFNYQADCAVPTFVISEAQNSQTVKITWQVSDHLRYDVQYRKKGYGEDDWFNAYAYNNETIIRNLEAGTVYEFRVGGECTASGGFAYSNINEFTIPTEDETAYYNCGIMPQININNQDPLPRIGEAEVFTAGDFPVVVVEANGSNGNFSGWGYITLPFLAKVNQAINVIDNLSKDENGEGGTSIGKYTRIRVQFENININTDYQLINGVVETSYDADWGSIVTIPTTTNEEENETVEEPTATSSEDGTSTTTNNDGTATNTEDTGDTPTSTENTDDTPTTTDDTEATPTTTIPVVIADPPPPGNTPEGETPEGGDTIVVINYEGEDYNDGDTIEVPYDIDVTNFAFILKNYPEGAEINWQILKVNGTDITSDVANNETNLDNLGINVESLKLFEIIANYNDEQIKVTFSRISEEFELESIFAYPDENENRKAYWGETLYLVKKTPLGTEDKRLIKFNAKISPDLDQDNILGLTWKHNGIIEEVSNNKKYSSAWLSNNSLLDFDEKEFEAKVLNLNSVNTVLEERSVNVKWVEGGTEANNISLNGVLGTFAQSLSTFEEFFEKMEAFSIGTITFKYDDVKTGKIITNEELKKSRLYKTTEKEFVTSGLSASKEKFISHPVLKVLERINIAKVGLTLGLQAGVKLEGGIEKVKFAENESYEPDDPYGTINPYGCMSVELGAEFLVDKRLLNIEISGKASTCIGGVSTYKFETEKYEGYIYLDPLTLTGSAVISSSTLDFNLIDWSDSIKVFDRIRSDQ